MGCLIIKLMKKQKFVADGVFRAELNDFFHKIFHALEISKQNKYIKVDVIEVYDRHSKLKKKEIIVKYCKTPSLPRSEYNYDTSDRCINQLKSLVTQRYNLEPNSFEIRLEKVMASDARLSATVQVDDLCSKFVNSGKYNPRDVKNLIKQVMSTYGYPHPRGCEVLISGKLRADRAKTKKFRSGNMTSMGQPVKNFVDEATRHIQLRKGVLGVKVRIAKAYDSSNKIGAF